LAFFDELGRFGVVEGQRLVVDPRGFESSDARFGMVAKELVTSGIDALLAAGDSAIAAAQSATRSVPILGISDDMVGAGFVRSLTRPGGNVTGVSILSTELNSKRLQLLAEAFIDARRIAVLADPRITTPVHVKMLRDVAHGRNLDLMVYEAAISEEIIPAVDAASKAGAQAMNVLASPLFSFNSRRITNRMLEVRMPAIFQWPEIAEEGGLLAYGPRITRVYRQMATQLVKLMHGLKPEELPIEQPTVFEFVANLKTAGTMGMTLPPSLLTRADEVIE
jgi:putative ABC transport system substrate-binding protein